MPDYIVIKNDTQTYDIWGKDINEIRREVIAMKPTRRDVYHILVDPHTKSDISYALASAGTLWKEGDSYYWTTSKKGKRKSRVSPSTGRLLKPASGRSIGRRY